MAWNECIWLRNFLLKLELFTVKLVPDYCTDLSKKEKISLYSRSVSSDKFSLAFRMAASLSLISSSSMTTKTEGWKCYIIIIRY